MRYLVLLAVATLWVVFAVSAVSKFRNYPAFVRATRALVPVGPRPVAAVVVVTECAIVVLLPIVPVLGLAVAAVLLGAFGVAIVGALRRGETAPCRCFGASARPLGVAQVVRNGLLAGLAVAGVLAAFAAPDAPHPAGVAIAVFSGLVLAVLTISFDDVIDLVAVERT